MTLTKAAFLKSLQCKEPEKVEIPGIGEVWLRANPQANLSRRHASYSDPSQLACAAAHRLIDQVMLDPKTPMFTEEDTEAIQSLDSALLARVIDALDHFDGYDQKKVNGQANGSSHTSQNSDETTG